jgi:hypothetical protein
MMRCPTCLRTYPDETVRFCRVDGATLASAAAALDQSSATRVLAPRATNEAPTEMLGSNSAPIQTTSKLAGTPAQLNQTAWRAPSSHGTAGIEIAREQFASALEPLKLFTGSASGGSPAASAKREPPVAE